MNPLLIVLKNIHSPSLNEFIRRIVFYFEIPLIKALFKLDGAILSQARGSIFNKQTYNFLFSDLDFSIVAKVDHHDEIFERAKKLKKIFLNLGELEIYTPSEWEELNLLNQSSLNDYWIKLQLIRKSKWQKDKIACASNSLDLEKHTRGLEITLARLNSSSYGLVAADIFPEMITAHSSKISLPFYSFYLERNISTEQNTHDSIYCLNEKQATAILSILPDTDVFPHEKLLKDLKLYIIQKERILTRVSLRVRKSMNQSFNAETFDRWLKDLTRRENLILKE